VTREGSQGPEDVSVILQQILASQATLHLREIERLHADLAQMESGMFDQARKGFTVDSAEVLFDIKADLARLRAIMGSQRDVFVRLHRGEFPVIPGNMLMQFRDVYDDIHRATETIDLLREISGTALDTYLMLATHRTNEIVKVLTILATFILPLTLVTGWYGMNFERMLGLDWKYGELYVLALFLAICAGLGVYLKRRKWL
jgi:magnesium transporter